MAASKGSTNVKLWRSTVPIGDRMAKMVNKSRKKLCKEASPRVFSDSQVFQAFSSALAVDTPWRFSRIKGTSLDDKLEQHEATKVHKRITKVYFCDTLQILYILDIFIIMTLGICMTYLTFSTTDPPRYHQLKPTQRSPLRWPWGSPNKSWIPLPGRGPEAGAKQKRLRKGARCSEKFLHYRRKDSKGFEPQRYFRLTLQMLQAQGRSQSVCVCV